MNILNQKVTMLKPTENNGINILKTIEYSARNCYASKDKITDDSCLKFVKNLIKNGHEAPLEFGIIEFELLTSRAVLAEITRHRLASFCVESQRYILENKDGIDFIEPEWDKNNSKYNLNKTIWEKSMNFAEASYNNLIANGCKPQEAREVLPNSTACNIIMQANVREWRHFFNLRCSAAAYPQMRVLALEMLRQASDAVPIVFDDLKEKYL